MSYKSKTYLCLESLGLNEGTVRARRGLAHAAFSGAQLAQGLGSGPASIYHKKDDDSYAFGVKSKSTGGALKPAGKGWRRAAEVMPGGKIRMSTPRAKSRMKGQLSAIDKSKHLSDEEKRMYTAAAQKAKGRKPAPREMRQAVQQAVKGVKRGPQRKPAAKPAAKAQTRTGRALDWIRKKVGLARRKSSAVA